MQTTFENRPAEIEGHINQLQYQCDVINDDVAAVATNDKKYFDRFNIIEQQLNKIEAERLKCSLRVFGLKETETSDKSLRTLVTRRYLVWLVKRKHLARLLWITLKEVVKPVLQTVE